VKKASKIAAVALLGLGALTLTGTAASAAVVCNGEGYCWHVHHAYHYPAGVGVVVHPNRWRWGHEDHYAWHEHRGRGYWRGGAWVAF
jgi:uncharacterized protein YraI